MAIYKLPTPIPGVAYVGSIPFTDGLTADITPNKTELAQLKAAGVTPVTPEPDSEKPARKRKSDD